MTHRVLSLRSALRFCVISLTFCLLACQGQAPASLTEHTVAVRTAINNNDTALFLSLADSVLSIREQTWESTIDGAGFMLGESNDTLVNTQNLSAFDLDAFLHSVTIEGDKPTSTNVTPSMLETELAGQESLWKTLHTALFLRGSGDVEHIVVMGFDKTSHKLRALYMN